MAGIGGVLDIVKIRKTGSKTGQKRFRIFLLTFLNSLGQDGSNGTPFYAVRSILTSNLDLDLDNLAEPLHTDDTTVGSLGDRELAELLRHCGPASGPGHSCDRLIMQMAHYCLVELQARLKTLSARAIHRWNR